MGRALERETTQRMRTTIIIRCSQIAAAVAVALSARVWMRWSSPWNRKSLSNSISLTYHVRLSLSLSTFRLSLSDSRIDLLAWLSLTQPTSLVSNDWFYRWINRLQGCWECWASSPTQLSSYIYQLIWYCYLLLLLSDVPLFDDELCLQDSSPPLPKQQIKATK